MWRRDWPKEKLEAVIPTNPTIASNSLYILDTKSYESQIGLENNRLESPNNELEKSIIF